LRCLDFYSLSNNEFLPESGINDVVILLSDIEIDSADLLFYEATESLKFIPKFLDYYY
jgi:hypothetical protein